VSVAIALLVSSAGATAGSAAGWLTPAAAVAAAGVGTAVGTGAGARGLVLLALFFVSGSALATRAGRPPRRSVRQVLANGWTAAAGALLIPIAARAGWAVLAGGLAAALADTWATEIGRRARRPPVLITTGETVAAGTSGGVTWLGTSAGIAGALAFAATAWLLDLAPFTALAAAGGGSAGMLADSLLGASLQARFRCATCGQAPETARHPPCATPAVHVGGPRWLDNDAVNALASGAGATLAALAVGAA
jgi:uncharacterized protein (TIGR00297 family)